ncbi:MAG TPA: response regulator transcription factor, partial [Hyphomicrobiaceae bacterium]|nr:response regulator transcription factor [Hyphomicrobiaceae bacterium]
PIRIAVVDDHPLLREGVVHVLSQEPDMEVVATGGSADDAVRIAEDALPDVMLLDMNMPGTGLSALDRISALCPSVRVIALTVREDHEAVSKALSLGARAYVLKGVPTDEFLGIIRNVYAGGSSISTTLAAKLLDDFKAGKGSPVSTLPPLTSREEQILHGIGRGLSNKEIARELDLAEKTIKHYVTNVLQKLHVRNRVEAALVARGAGAPGK